MTIVHPYATTRTELSAKLKVAEAKIEALRAEINDRCAERFALLTESGQLENENETLSRELDNCSIVTEQLDRKIESMHKLNMALQRKLNAQQDNCTLNDENATLHARLKELTVELRDQDAYCAELCARIDELKASDLSADDEISKLRGQNIDARVLNEQRAAEAGRLRAEIYGLRAENTVRRTEYDNQRAEYSDLCTRHCKLRTENEELSVTNLKLKVEIYGLQTANTALHTENESLNHELSYYTDQ